MRVLRGAERTVSSVLTGIECARVLARQVASGRVSEGSGLAALHLFDRAAAKWAVLGLVPKVVDRARGSFPVEPVRTLDGVHLATASVFVEELGPLIVVTLDDRIRRNAKAMRIDTGP